MTRQVVPVAIQASGHGPFVSADGET